MWTSAIFIVGTSVLLQATFTSGKCLVENEDDNGGTITREDLERLVRGSTEFGLKIFEIDNREGEWHQGDIIISPISVWSALTAAWHGAQGETRSQIERVLNYGSSDRTRIHLLYQNLTNSLWHSPNGPRDYTLNLVNRVYLDETFEANENTLDYLGYDVEPADLSDNDVRNRILYQQEKQPTNFLHIYRDNWYNPNLAMLLMNHVDFKGFWKQPFDSQNTRPGIFLRNPPMNVDLMSHPVEQHKTAQSPELGCSALELPLEGDNVRMVLLLPDENTTVGSLLSKLNVDTLTDLLDSLRLTSVHVWMPQFYARQYRLLDYTLMDLGIRDLFAQGDANLNGFSDVPTVSGDDQHHPMIDFNGAGIEVPGATTSVPSSSVSAPELVINRPFVVVVQHQPTGVILFLAAIKDPTPLSPASNIRLWAVHSY